VPKSVPHRNLFGAGLPSIVRFSYGKGQVFLIAHHPVMIPGGRINGIQVERPIKNWQYLVDTVPPERLNAYNYQSWNILHAAFQVLLHQNPEPIKIGGLTRPLTDAALLRHGGATGGDKEGK